MKTNLPNILTYLRILVIPIFLFVYYLPYKWVPLACTTMFVVAAITDWLDGYLARRLNQTSRFGAFLDPVADKLMVAVVLVAIVDTNPTKYEGLYIAVPAAIIIGREITISALREWMAELGERAKVAVSMVGKVKTTVQMVALGFLIYAKPLFGLPIADIGLVLLMISAVLTMWSMVVYLKAAWPILMDEKNS